MVKNNFNVLCEYLKNILVNDEKTYLFIADGLESYVLQDFKKICPKHVLPRIINVGISEQNAMSMAAGLALGGKIPYVVMFAPFMTMRAAEQIKLDICYANANVKLIGTNAGFYGTSLGGYSHCALEDIATFNAMPNIQIFSPSPNQNEFETILKNVHKHNGPVYIRLNAAEAEFDGAKYDVEYQKIAQVIHGTDTAIIATGYSVEMAKLYASKMSKEPSVYSVHCLKPFDEDGLLKIIKRHKLIYTIEEHAAGGLASIVSMIIAKHGLKVKFVPIYSNTNNYNCVVESRDTIYNRFLLDVKSFAKNYINLVIDKKILFFARQGCVDSKNRIMIIYKICNVPVLRKQRREQLKMWRPKNHYFIFGLRII